MASAPAGLWPPSSHSSEPGHEQARERAVVERLHARGPAHVEEPALDGGGIGEAEAFQLQRGGDGRAGVDDLVLAHQRRQRQVHQPFRALVDQPAALLEGFVVLAPDDERGADTLSCGVDGGGGFRRLARDDGRDAAI